MKITTFNPLIVTKDAEAVVRLFEELGFERRHTPAGISGIGSSYVDYRLKNADGFYVDVAQSSTPRTEDFSCIRINVDDFDAAHKLLTDHGFKSATGGKITETSSSKEDVMVSPSGFSISLVQHIKN